MHSVYCYVDGLSAGSGSLAARKREKESVVCVCESVSE